MTFNSCKENPNEFKGLEYIFIGKHGRLDTIYREIKYHFKSDTMNIITYREIWNENDIEVSFKFPKSKDRIVNETRLIEEKVIEFEGKDYIIYKYLMDYPDGDDEEMLYFYSPEYGILIHKSAWWGNYDKLTNFNTPEDGRIIYYLSEIISNGDKDFFIDWK